MSRRLFPPQDYKNQQLMDELNEFCIQLKVWLCEETKALRERFPKPTSQDIDNMQNRLNRVLKEDAKPFIIH